MKTTFTKHFEANTTWCNCHARFDMQNVRDNDEIISTSTSPGDKLPKA
jgi:hypothetical protein